jgi:hypothetical protein
LLLLPTVAASGPPVYVYGEDFEGPRLSDVLERWDDVAHADRMALSTDVPSGSPGRHSLMIVRDGDDSTGGHLYTRLPAAHDSLFVSFAVKFSRDHGPVRHFVTLGGYDPPTRWPQGAAGRRPSGADRFTTGIEPGGRRWEWGFYSYWMEMRGDSAAGYFGNRFAPEPPVPVVRGEWMHVSVAIRLNEPPDGRNGSQSFAVDGTDLEEPQAVSFPGLRWRSSPDLNLNFVWLLYYVTEHVPGRADTVWLDDLVIATEPLTPERR